MKKIIKPWGWELWFAHSSKYAGKILFIRKGHRLSKQYHRRKHETIYTDQGRWTLEINGRKKLMKPGSAETIRPGVVHRFCSPFQNVRLLEVSSPQLKDVVRLEDDYGRGTKRG
jgi:mannose-6-phosphate isomerase-like protein (cupin superfamily)